MQAKAESGTGHRKTLVVTLRDALREQIEAGRYAPGDRLPSEAQLTREFDVSRTVVREAVAALRADRLVEPRQGAGVFVLAPRETVSPPFQKIDYAKISTVLEMLELRTAVEVEAAGLAAQRCSPSQEEVLIDRMQEVDRLAQAGEPTTDADFALHLAIAEASNNPRFGEFLSMIGPSVIPRRALDPDARHEPASGEYLAAISGEHARIVNAILERDEAAAQEAMRNHLKGSQTRYRLLLRGATRTGN
ncbi:DNA-binding FadR family transcriptional regulator [Limimaricola variabilis]|uniref:DNA-binding FadR family transcriptional regulator n=1 Tax=Limimaricola variabilis TaxID=1492771 RepID=A0ABR6HSN3_9RHOB|nr:FadR/GntR family transcriptional regulator [Limimaricola variabilis]MBB3713568.1 DNA-binding FadR family transcriptional regulator [Limimaricola variabilis]